MTRIDKYLLYFRLLNTRAKASEACGKGRVMVENVPVKASRAVVIGDTIQIKRPPVVYTFRVLDVPPTRIGAKLVEQFLQNITSPDQLELIEAIRIDRQNQRARGFGRPTKRERRDLEAFFGEQQLYFVDEDDGWDV